MKAAKRGQDLRVDMPAIGPRTVAEAARAGLAGIAVGAGSTLILDRERTVEAADRLGLVLLGVAAAGERGSLMDAAGRAASLWLIAGEESGDQLGAKLMRALRARSAGTAVRFDGRRRAGHGGGGAAEPVPAWPTSP